MIITQVEDMNTRDGKCKWNEKGFSLVELIIVIAIMAVVIGTVVFSVSMVFSANAKACCNNLQRAIADCKVTTMGKSEAWLVLYRGSDNQIYCQMYYKEAVILDGIHEILRHLNQTFLLSGSRFASGPCFIYSIY